MNPQNIEKCSTKFTFAVYNERTVNALIHYSAICGKGKGWRETATFVAKMLKLFNVINVKTPTLGKKKRDYTRDPVRSVTDWKITFLNEMATFFEKWEHSGGPGMEQLN